MYVFFHPSYPFIFGDSWGIYHRRTQKKQICRFKALFNERWNTSGTAASLEKHSFGPWNNPLHPGKRTNDNWKTQPFEDVSPTRNADFSGSHVSVQGGKLLGEFTGFVSVSKQHKLLVRWQRLAGHMFYQPVVWRKFQLGTWDPLFLPYGSAEIHFYQCFICSCFWKKINLKKMEKKQIHQVVGRKKTIRKIRKTTQGSSKLWLGVKNLKVVRFLEGWPLNI